MWLRCQGLDRELVVSKDVSVLLAAGGGAVDMFAIVVSAARGGAVSSLP